MFTEHLVGTTLDGLRIPTGEPPMALEITVASEKNIGLN
jgi:hypothetical protein